MPGIRDSHFSAGTELGDQAGREMTTGATNHAAIQSRKHQRRIEAVFRLIADRTHQYRYQHGRADAFAGDISDHYQQLAIGL